jgi:DNA helicase-2/ATP-dependent DNA helicase PcrA
VSEFLSQLNEVQREAVTKIDGPALVIAGAGSGKTRVLTFRIAYLLSKGVKANSILALTFTNKAAKEMKERISALVGKEAARNLWMGTFHSIFARILRSEAEKLGFPSTFTIYDSSDSKSAIKAIIKELNLDDQVYKVNDVFGRISNAKNNLITPMAYINSAAIQEQDFSSRKPRIGDVYKVYMQKCKNAGAMDFDDLLLYTNILFRDFPEVVDKYRALFRYLLVDEYQDTNYSQYLIVNRLAGAHRNVCVVGDDAQSIYSFRGAKIENILNFKNDYPEYQLFKLEQNYRSTQTIVNAANSIIAKNRGQIKKNSFSEKEAGEKIKVIESYNDHEEAFIVTKMLNEIQTANNCPFSDFVILYRTNAQSRIFEESLRKRAIPYKVFGSLSFYQRKEIKDLLAYCRMCVNPHDDEAFKRIINYPARGIGNTTLERIEAVAAGNNVSLWTVINSPVPPEGMNRGILQKVMQFVQLIKNYSARLYTDTAFDLVDSIAKTSGIIGDLKSENTIENIAKLENVEELLNSIKDFCDSAPEDNFPTLDQYLENVALLTDADTEKEEDRNRVSLMTIHSAKGLEFGYVFISGLEEDLFPNRMTASSPQDLEEERRLFYVALTRAEKQVVLSYALSRYKWGTPTDCTASRFINEIDPQYIDSPEGDGDENSGSEERTILPRGIKKPLPAMPKRGEPVANQVNPLQRKNVVPVGQAIQKRPVNVPVGDFQPDDPSRIVEGMTIEHQRFGLGKVTAIEGDAHDRKATVVFVDGTPRQLLLKFARLKIVK